MLCKLTSVEAGGHAVCSGPDQLVTRYSSQHQVDLTLPIVLSMECTLAFDIFWRDSSPFLSPPPHEVGWVDFENNKF